ncbi:MAG TPA: thermonuclease family protein [Ignavibacteria bacterium]|nr:thermonuclease family protein [Ignavibacteria bacterium]
MTGINLRSFKAVILNAILVVLFSSYVCFSQTDSSLIIGEFKISKVTDGDTFRFENLDKPTRLLGIDTEETFKTDDAEQKTNEIAANWEAFYISEKGDSKMPVKTDSPLGFEAWKWAEEFFKNVDYVRLEKEDDERSVDIFGRYLVYLIAVMKDGTEINYNIECVKQGYSPYFNKYGNSKRFNKEFIEAQNYARDKSLGIWDPNKKHYPDYDKRLEWWNLRAKQIDDFETKYSGNELYFNLASDKDYARLENYLDQEITVFGNISDILTKKYPYLMRIPHTKNETFEIVIHEENAGMLADLDMDTKKEFSTYIKGKLEKYNGKYQIVLRNKEDLWVEY